MINKNKKEIKRVLLIESKIIKRLRDEKLYTTEKIKVLLLKKSASIFSSREFPELNKIEYIETSELLLNSVKKGKIVHEGILMELTFRKIFKIISKKEKRKDSFASFTKWQENEKEIHLGIGA